MNVTNEHQPYIDSAGIDKADLPSKIKAKIDKWNQDVELAKADKDEPSLVATWETTLKANSESILADLKTWKEKKEKKAKKAEDDAAAAKKVEDDAAAAKKVEDDAAAAKKVEDDAAAAATATKTKEEEAAAAKKKEEEEGKMSGSDKRKKKLEGVLREMYNSGKTEVTEDELEEKGFNGWTDLGFGGTWEFGEFKLVGINAFAETWKIEKVAEKAAATT